MEETGCVYSVAEDEMKRHGWEYLEILDMRNFARVKRMYDAESKRKKATAATMAAAREQCGDLETWDLVESLSLIEQYAQQLIEQGTDPGEAYRIAEEAAEA